MTPSSYAAQIIHSAGDTGSVSIEGIFNNPVNTLHDILVIFMLIRPLTVQKILKFDTGGIF